MSLQMNALFRRYADETAGYDQAEADAGREHAVFKRDSKKNLGQNQKKRASNSATRGMTHSGANLEENVDLQKAYETAGADADAQYNSFLTGVAKKRLASETQYNSDKAILDLQTLLGG